MRISSSSQHQAAGGWESSKNGSRQLEHLQLNPTQLLRCSMKFKFLFVLAMSFMLSLSALAQSDSGIKQDTKDAAQSTGKAAKKSGQKIKKGTKKAVNKGAKAT